MEGRDILAKTITQRETWIEPRSQETIITGIITRITRDWVI